MADLSPTLNNVVDSAEKVRKSAGANSALQQLATSIAAQRMAEVAGRAQSPEKASFAVVADGRRLSASRLLPIPARPRSTMLCRAMCFTAVPDSAEISLAENSVHARCIPADEFEVFRLLVGMSEADDLPRFGVTEAVSRHVNLARLSRKRWILYTL